MKEVSIVLKPLGDRVIVEVVEQEETTSSGIVLPDSAKEKPQEGQVVAVGSGRVTENGEKVTLEVNEGDRVIYSKFAGTEVEKDGKEYLVLRENDILAVVQ
nr:co-chaperone GroES [Alkalibacillus aidingensis]